MIDRTHELPVVRQCQVLGLARSTAYSTPRPVSPEDLALMHRIDDLHLLHPFAGSRMLRDLLRQEGHRVGRKRVAGLLERMGIKALYRKPNTRRKADGAHIYPYLLRELTIDRPNPVWAADIPYIPMRQGFVYRVVVIDWSSKESPVVAAVQHADHGLLPGRRPGGDPSLRHARDLQHRPGQPVHQHRFHRPAEGARHPHPHGRQGLLASTTFSSSGCGAP